MNKTKPAVLALLSAAILAVDLFVIRGELIEGLSGFWEYLCLVIQILCAFILLGIVISMLRLIQIRKAADNDSKERTP